LNYVIETENLGRTYQTYKKPEGLMNSVKGFWNRQTVQKSALKNVSLKITPGQIIGLVGSNGAGKTTLLKILSGLIVPTEGTAHVLGSVPSERDYEFLRRISILLGQKNQLWWDISALDSYALLSRIYDLDADQARKRVYELAKKLQCDHVLETQLRRLSLGERMKMEIIGALLHQPEVMFLDEPTIGLDIVAQSTIREFLAEYVKDKGPTIILTSHYMDDIAKLADQLLLISRGEIVYDGTVSSFSQKASQVQTLQFRLDKNLLKPIPLKSGLNIEPGQREYQVQVVNEEVPFLIAELTKESQLQDLKLIEADFEDVIRQFLEKESRVF
jgi:ABC-2 type transport system ATP-binding protein